MKLSITKIKALTIFCIITSSIAEIILYQLSTSYAFHQSFEFIGKIAFPLFAFVVANGWIHTKNKSDYFMRMVIFACISQIPYTMAFYTFNFLTPVRENNIDFYFIVYGYILAILCILISLFSRNIVKFSLSKSLIILGSVLVSSIFLDIDGFRYLCDPLNIFYLVIVSLFMIYCFEKIKSNSLKWYEQAFMVLTFILSFIIFIDLNSFRETLNIGLVFLLYLTHKNKKIQSLIIVLWGLIVYGFIHGVRPYGIHNIYGSLLLCIPAFISAIVILLYDDSIVPKKARWFYWLYPVHLLILGIVNLVLFR